MNEYSNFTKLFRGIAFLLALQLLAGTANAQDNVYWNFGTTTPNALAATSTNTVVPVSGCAAVAGNHGTLTAPINASSTSTGYTGATGGENISVGTIENNAYNSTTSSYFSFIVTPLAGYSINLTGMSYGMWSSATGTLKYMICSSIGGFGTPIDSGTEANNSVWMLKTNTFNVTGTPGTPIEIRMYCDSTFLATGGGGGTGTWRVDDVTINYTVVPAGCSGTPTVGTVSPSPAAFCGSGSSAITLTGASSGAGISYQWDSSTSATGPFNHVVGATSTSYTTPTLTDTVYYQCVTTCATSSLSATSPQNTITVNPLPAVPVTIAPASATICAGLPTALTDATAGGTWSSSNTNVATVDGMGHVTTLTNGTSTIAYAISNSCGTNSVTALVTVNPLPATPLAITPGPVTVCAGMPTALTDATTGGVWSSSNTNAAIVDGIGNITTLTNGTANIAYTISNSCGTNSVTALVTVNPLPAVPVAIAPGLVTVCAGGPTALSDITPGGVWSSSNTNVATIDGSGNITTLTNGASTIAYTISNGCGTNSVTALVTVNPLPTVPVAITPGPVAVCAGLQIALSDVTAGGIWSSSNTDVATVDGTGHVTTIPATVAGTSTIAYTISNSCGTNSVTAVVTVNPLPVVPMSITPGPVAVCAGVPTALSDVTSGGVWSSSNTGVATIDGTGHVTTLTNGTSAIAYTISNGCGTNSVTAVVTVNPLPVVPVAITPGPVTVCAGVPTALSDVTSGGAWSSSNTNIATVDGTGHVITVTNGTSTIAYTISNSCGTNSVTAVVAVNPLPASLAAITPGPVTICAGVPTALSDITPGGVWSSSNTGVATVNGTGHVTTIPAIVVGTSTIAYTISNSCGTNSVTAVVTVNPLPATPSAITPGPVTVCAGSSTALSDVTPGGVWSSNNSAVATVNGTGHVTTLAAGTSTIAYTVSNSCGTGSVTTVVTVNPLPGSLAAITGTTTVCAGNITALTDTTPGGVWSSANSTVATVDGTGHVNGITSGTSMITYTVSNSCGTNSATIVVTVNPWPVIPAVITPGPVTVCAGTPVTLSDITLGGVWSSSNTTVATVNSTGHVTTLNLIAIGGSSTIAYAVSNSCGTVSVTAVITVNPLPATPAAISGTTAVCAGSITALTDVTTGGVWSSTNSTIATIDATGRVSGITAGTAAIAYSISNSCGTASITTAVTVDPLPGSLAAIIGATAVCTGSAAALSDITPGGIWSSNSTTIATVDATGHVNGIANGTATITYTINNSCGTASVTAAVTVSSLPTAGSVTGILSVCNGSTTQLMNPVSGGVWGTTATTIATVDSVTGLVTGVSVGAAGISYVVTNICGSAVAAVLVMVNPLPSPVIVAAGPVLHTMATYAAYQWLLGGLAIPGATNATYTATANGTYSVTVTDNNGCPATSAGHAVADAGVNGINANDNDIKIYPNPASMTLTIAASEKVNISICSMDGKTLIEQKEAEQINVSNLAPGLYIIRIYDQGGILIKTAKFTKE